MESFSEVTNFSWNGNCLTRQLNNMLDFKKTPKTLQKSPRES